MTKKQFQNSLGVEFRKLRKRSGLTQTSVATTAGISFPAIRKLERGLGNLATWTKALDALGWTLRGRNLPPGDSIGRQIAILRKRQKLSQRPLATMSGLTHPTIVGLEVRNTGRLASVSAILTVLGARPVLTPAGERGVHPGLLLHWQRMPAAAAGQGEGPGLYPGEVMQGPFGLNIIVVFP